MNILRFFQTYSDGINTMLAITGAILALYWWFCQRDRKPRCMLRLEMTDALIESSKHYIHVEITLNNIGRVRLCTDTAMLWIRQIDPLLAPHKISDNPLFERTPKGNSFETPPLIQEDKILIDREFEPGESESIYRDEILAIGPKTILIYAFIRDVTIPIKPPDTYGKGWSVQKIFTLHD